MAPQPKRRMSTARTGKRRTSIHLTALNFTACPNCGKMRLPHTVCKECGVYSNRVVVAPKVKTTIKKLTKPEIKNEEVRETKEQE
jgi:large subunit ribosomal protein L32